ncbi:MAG: AraC family transcriptional regulator [Veillonellaceae bacterium]|nr:AraC family transcriptional regulator [Veillonellaceae bacterium]
MTGYFNYLYQHGWIRVESYIYRIGTYHYNWHPDIELLLVLKGRIEVCHDGAYSNLQERDIAILDSQCGHATLALEPDTMAMVVHIHPDFFAAYDEEFSSYHFYLETTDDTRESEPYRNLRHLAAKLMLKRSALVAKKDFLDLQDESDLYRLAAITYELIVSSRQRDKVSKPLMERKEVFEQMIAYIEAHYREKIELKDIARIGQYNESYASQFFKRHLGISFLEYVLRMRLREATVQLVNTELTIAQVALLCGFSDVKAFNKVFKNRFHSTPSEYRKTARSFGRKTKLQEWKEFISSDDTEVISLLEDYVIEIKEPISDGFIVSSRPNLGRVKELLEEALQQIK